MSFRPRVCEVIQELERLGCRAISPRGGSHQKWRTPGGAAMCLVISQPGREITLGVFTHVRRILRRECLFLGWDEGA